MTASRVLPCPADGTALVSTRYEGEVTVDRCPTCGGVWLDVGELEQVQELVEREHPAEVTELQTMMASMELARQKQLPPRKCPVSGQPMSRKEYGYCSQILIDVSAHGIWLDRGELQALEQFFESQRPDLKEKQGGLWSAFWGTLRRWGGG